VTAHRELALTQPPTSIPKAHKPQNPNFTLLFSLNNVHSKLTARQDKMPLPPEAITIAGGCNCAAIRYRVSIPALSQRPPHPTSDPSSQDPVHLPFVCIDHCNDCRRATGSLLGVVLCSPTSFVEISFTPEENVINERKERIEPSTRETDAARTWVNAEEVFPPGGKDGVMERDDTCLKFYTSSEGRTRAFCGNCGTQFAYSAYPYPEPWPRM